MCWRIRKEGQGHEGAQCETVSPNKRRRRLRKKDENESLQGQEEERVKSKGEKQEERKMRKYEDEVEFLDITSANVSHFL